MATSDNHRRRINGNSRSRRAAWAVNGQHHDDGHDDDTPTNEPALLPQDERAEGGLIDSALQAPGEVLKLCAKVKPQYFFRAANQVIWEQMQALYAAGHAFEHTILVDALRTAGKLEDAGGEMAILELGNRVTHSAFAAEYARIICEKFLSRFIIKMSGQLASIGYRGDAQEIASVTNVMALEIQEVLATLGITETGASARFAFMTDEEVEALPDPKWLIHEVLVEDSVSVAFGDYGSGKSFLALDWALSIATGFPWMDRIVKRGLVAYIAGEGISGMKRRIRAWKKHHRWTSGPTGLHLLGTAPQLLHPEDVQALLVALRGLPEVPVMVVVDTLARSMVGGDENTAQDMGLAVAAAETIRAEFGCHVLVVHHKPAGASKTRGSTALPGAAQTVIDVTKDNNIMTLQCPKQKDYREFLPMKYRLHQVDLDERDHENNSLVLVPITAYGEEDVSDGPVKLTRAAENVLAILKKSPGHAAQTATLINEMAKPPYRMVKGSTINGLHNLEDAGLAENTGTLWRLLE